MDANKFLRRRKSSLWGSLTFLEWSRTRNIDSVFQTDIHSLGPLAKQETAEVPMRAPKGELRMMIPTSGIRDANQVLLDRIAKLESALNRVGSTVEL